MATVVIKIGGGAGIDPGSLAAEIAGLVRAGERIVVVHGGSHEIDTLSAALGYPVKTLTSPSGHTSRRTDRRTLEIFEMACCGKVNKGLVERLRREGVDAVGLSGLDGGLWIGMRKDAIRAVEDGRTVVVRDDLSGRVEAVDDRLLMLLLDAGRVPVVTPPAVTRDGVAINVDADRAAAATAVAIHADELLLLSNVPGVLADAADAASLIRFADAAGLDAARSAATGRMKNKVLAAEEALVGGVKRVVIGSAHSGPGGEAAVMRARAGAGTVFTTAVPA